ncbi:hypothetical protein RCH09_003132 [Actimicrobium sp. GrIS 1.19]|nr:hypothetical protein [Actimicrobium sp. GrIS 1.19]
MPGPGAKVAPAFRFCVAPLRYHNASAAPFMGREARCAFNRHATPLAGNGRTLRVIAAVLKT